MISCTEFIPAYSELFRFLQDLLRTELDAKATAFAPILQDFNLAVSGLHPALI